MGSGEQACKTIAKPTAATGVLFLLAGTLWLIHAFLRRYVFGFLGAAIFLLAGTLWIVGWMRWRRLDKTSAAPPSKPVS
jgi:hypothetical protein